MLKISLTVLFLMTMATFTIAASSLPVPPDSRAATIEVASRG
jgi:hypothetical protein